MTLNLKALRKSGALAGTLGYYWLFICLGLDLAILGPTIPALAGQTGAGLGQMGLLFLVGALGGALGTALSGRVFDRAHGHAVLGVAQLCAAGLIAAIPFVPWYWLLVAVVTCKGVALGFINTGANTLLTWMHGEKVGPFMNGLHFCFGVGSFVAPLLVAQVLGLEGGYRLAFWVLAAFAGLAGLRMLALGGSPRQSIGEAGQAAGSGSGPRPYLFVFIAALFLFFYVGAEISFGGWIYTYATKLGLASEAGAAYLNSAFWFSFTVGRLISIPVATRFKPVRVIPLAVLGGLAFLSLAWLFPGSSSALWAAAIGLGFCMAPVWPTGFTLAGQSIDLSGKLSGLILLGDSFGGMLLPSALGEVIEAAGPRAMIYLIFASLALNLAAFGGMLKLRPKNRR
jgi:FHS family Na+ dependent glucose MFS transporter 1